MERGWKPNVEVSPACPRCGSSNTKFCYYNNYSLTQPRYFCKGCRRYWTKGGSLRNVPIGGGCRKSRRGKYLRATTDGGLSSRTLARNGIESTSSVSADPDGTSTSIDLAAVYANFLNPTPLPDTTNIQGSETLSGAGIVIPSIEFPNFHLGSQESTGFLECGPFPGRLPETELLGNGNNSMFLCGIDQGFHQNHEVTTGNGFTSLINPMMDNAMLPPLPGEEVAAVSEGILWPGSDEGLSNQTLPRTTNEMPPGVVESGQNSQVLNGNVSPFSALNLEAFFRS